LFSATGIALCLFVLSVPWVKLEFMNRLAISELIFVVPLLLFSFQYTSGHVRLYRQTMPPSKYLAVLSFWALAVFVSGFNVWFTSVYLFDAFGMIYLALIAFFITLMAAESEDRVFEVVRWLRVAVIIVVAIGILGIFHQLLTDKFDLFFYSNAGKLIASFRFPNQLGGFLVLFFPLLWEEAQREGPLVRKLFYVVVLLALVGCVVATGSRSSVGALIFGLGLYGFFYLIRANVKMLIAGGALVLFGAIVIRVLYDQFGVVQRALSVLSFETIQNGLTDPWRLQNWSLGLELFAQNPINGFGLGNVQMINEHEIHNSYISVLAEMGIVGALAFVLIMGYVVITAIRNLSLAERLSSIYWSSVSRALLIGFITFAVYSTQHMMLRSRFLWLAIGVIVAIHVVLRLKFRDMTELEERTRERAGESAS